MEPIPKIQYIGKSEEERIQNAQFFSLITNLLKKIGLELSYNEQYALVDGSKMFAKSMSEEDLKSGSKFNVPKFKGKTEKERIENAMFATLLQNILQRFTNITEDERSAIDVLISQRVIPTTVEVEDIEC